MVELVRGGSCGALQLRAAACSLQLRAAVAAREAHPGDEVCKALHVWARVSHSVNSAWRQELLGRRAGSAASFSRSAGERDVLSPVHYRAERYHQLTKMSDSGAECAAEGRRVTSLERETGRRRVFWATPGCAKQAMQRRRPARHARFFAVQRRYTPRGSGASDGLGTTPAALVHVIRAGAGGALSCPGVRACERACKFRQLRSWAVCALRVQMLGFAVCVGAVVHRVSLHTGWRNLSSDCILPRPGAVLRRACNLTRHSLHSAVHSECAARLTACAPTGRFSEHLGAASRPLCRQKRAHSPSCCSRIIRGDAGHAVPAQD